MTLNPIRGTQNPINSHRPNDKNARRHGGLIKQHSATAEFSRSPRRPVLLILLVRDGDLLQSVVITS